MDRAPAERSEVVSQVAEQLPVTASATTSRALLDNDAVRVVAFAFDTGEQLTEHTVAASTSRRASHMPSRRSRPRSSASSWCAGTDRRVTRRVR